jgi:plastocyanin
MLRGAFIGPLLIVAAAQAAAAPLTVRVFDSSGRPVRDAVVTFRPAGAPGRLEPSGSYSVSQKDLQFHPFVLVVPVGAKVSFPNLDPTRHHVYSFSPAKKFELKLFAKDQSRSVVFDKAGVVALGCNIHDGMTAFVVVTDSPWTARTGATGIAAFQNVPAGAGKVTVWHPYLRAPGNRVEQAAGPARTISFSVALRAPPMAMSNGY